jgi:hypothetical protein
LAEPAPLLRRRRLGDALSHPRHRVFFE